MKNDLARRQCMPCQGNTPRLTGESLEQLYRQLDDGWTVVDEHHLEREYRFKNFRQALDFTNHVGEIAERQGHHPYIYLWWGRVKLKIWTHKIDGLTESDFILAAKVDRPQASENIKR